MILVMIALTSVAYAGNPAAQTSIFHLGAGGRALGMGGASVAINSDATAVFWNPAALTNLADRSLSLMYLPLPEGTNYSFASFGWPTLDYGTFSIGAFLMTTGDIERRDALGRSDGVFSANEQLYLVGYGKQLHRRVAVGATLKLYGQSIDGASAFAGGADLGLRLSLSEQIHLGVNAQNVLAPEIRLERDNEKLPLTLKGGIGLRLPISEGRHSLTLAADVDKIENVDPLFHVGGEFAIQNAYFLRAGYDVDQISFGAGLKINLVRLGYAFRTQDFFSAQHRVSVDVALGGSLESIMARREQERREAAEQLAKETRERELTYAQTQARYFYQNGMYDSAQSYYQKVFALTGKADDETAQRLQEIDQRREDQLTQAIRAGVLAESDSLKAAELFTDLDEALRVKDIDAAEVMLARLRPAFGADDRFRQGEGSYNLLVGERITALRSEAAQLAAKGQVSEAAVRNSEILRLNPNDQTAQRSLAQINGRIRALELLKSGVAAINAGDSAQARQLLAQALAANPQESTAQELLTKLDPGRATNVATLADIQKDPEAWKQYLDGIEQFRAAKYDEAIRLWESVLARFPGNPETVKNIQQAKLRLQAGDARP